MPPHEHVSVVILTKDEAENIRECIDSVLAQSQPQDEIVVVDSASSDRTVEIAVEFANAHPGRVRVHAFPENVTFGQARNTGVQMARREVVVFVSADAVPEVGWLDALRARLLYADIVYGRQRHAPPRIDAVTVSRGLRYHRFDSPGESPPEAFASNVNAAYRREAFDRVRFDDALPGSEDVAFAREARLAGLRIAYAADAVVGHKDVTSWRTEWRKHQREGTAAAMLRSVLGAPVSHFAWAFAVGMLGLAAVVAMNGWVLFATFAVFFLPTLRRLAASRARRYGTIPLLAGVAVSPVFDLAFLGGYIHRRVRTSR